MPHSNTITLGFFGVLALQLYNIFGFGRPRVAALRHFGLSEPEQGEYVLFSFHTSEPNELVRPVHSKATTDGLDGQGPRRAA